MSAQNLLDEYLVRYREAAEKRPPNPMRLSSSGHCIRKRIYLKYTTEAELIEPRLQSLFDLGHMVHASERIKMIELGFTLRNVEADVEFTVTRQDLSSFTVPGHKDGDLLWDGEAYVLDIKTMSSTAFDRLRREGVSYEYVAQLNAYMAASDMRQAILWAYCKNDSERAVIVVERDDEIVGRVAEEFRLVEAHRPGDEMPPVPDGYQPYERRSSGRGTGIMVLFYKCSSCPFRADCFPDFAPESRADGKTYYVRDDRLKPGEL